MSTGIETFPGTRSAKLPLPDRLPNWIDGEQAAPASNDWLPKRSPHSGAKLFEFARSRAEDVRSAIVAAAAAQPAWAATPAVQRGLILHEIVKRLQARTDDMAAVVAAETGKSPAESRGEVGGAAQCGLFYASEGQRLFGRTTTSGATSKFNMTVRRPVGVAGLIIAANTPIANVAWKVFPALICGNAAVLKAAEDTPGTAWLFAEIAREAGLPPGVLNVVQGLGGEAGAALAADERVAVVSFTGSSAVGRGIAAVCAKRMAKVSLELGGKNPLVVCDDADLDNAVTWTVRSAFSNAGQRCASGSRIIVDDAVYDDFVARLLAATAALRVGPTDADDLGPVINERQMTTMLAAVETAVARGATLLAGGKRLTGPEHVRGCYVPPTLLADVDPRAAISTTELFGPIACLYRAHGYDAALALANDSPYGLTACIHTRSIHRAMHFAEHVSSGVAVVNMGTFGSEPHMPFGGLRASGNGTREPGPEALDVYSNLQDVYIGTLPEHT